MKALGWLGLAPVASLVLLTQGTDSLPGTGAQSSLEVQRLSSSPRRADRPAYARRQTQEDPLPHLSGQAVHARHLESSTRPAPQRKAVSLEATRENVSREHPGLNSGRPEDLDELIRSAKNEGASAPGNLDVSSGNPGDLDELIRAAKNGVPPPGPESTLPLSQSGGLDDIIRSAKRGDDSGVLAGTPKPRRHSDDWESSQTSSQRGDDFEESTLGQGDIHADVFPSLTRSDIPMGEQPFMTEPHFEKEPLVQPLEKPQPLGEAAFVPSEVGNIPDDEFLSGLSHGARQKAEQSITFQREEETEKAVAKEMTENYNAWKPRRRGHKHHKAGAAGKPLEPASEETKHRFSQHNLVEQIESEAATAEADHIEVRYREPPRPDASAPNATGEPKFFPPTHGSALHGQSAASRRLAPTRAPLPSKAPPAPVSMVHRSEAAKPWHRCLAGAFAMSLVVPIVLGGSA